MFKLHHFSKMLGKMRTYFSILIFVLYVILSIIQFTNAAKITEDAESSNMAEVQRQDTNMVDSNLEIVYEALAVQINTMLWSSTPSARLADIVKIDIESQNLTYEHSTIIQEMLEFLCHEPELENNQEQVRNSLANLPEGGYCLFIQDWNTNSRKCPSQVKPLFIQKKELDNSTRTCGKTKTSQMHSFGFNLCKVFQNATDPKDIVQSVKMISIYDVCYDTSNEQTLWTKHTIQTGVSLRNPNLSLQPTEPWPELSTEPFLRASDTFTKIAQTYETYNKQENSPYKMIPQMLVPLEDIALDIWKRPAKHYLNTAPLWENLAPLMEVINDGIRTVSIFLNYKLQDENMEIYTTTYSHDRGIGLWKIINKFNPFRKQTFGLNIWCKFIYHPERDEGMMIYLHNLPDNPPPPIKDDSQIDNNEPQGSKKYNSYPMECENPFPCDFQEWSSQSISISNELLQYAYCCPPDTEKINELFSLNFEVRPGIYNIDGWVKKILAWKDGAYGN